MACLHGKAVQQNAFPVNVLGRTLRGDLSLCLGFGQTEFSGKVSFNRSSYKHALEGFSNVAVMVSQQDYDYTAATSQGNYGNSVKVHSRV